MKTYKAILVSVSLIGLGLAGNLFAAGAPTVNSVSPVAAEIGGSITLRGDGFTSSNIVRFNDYVAAYGVASSDGTTLTFTVPSSLNFECYFSSPACLIASPMTMKGVYKLSVKNENGISNQINFTVGSNTTSDLRFDTISIPNGTVGASYSATLNAAGGTDSYSWKVSNGSLPPGLSLISAVCIAAPCKAPATISGTLTTSGTYTFTITVTSGTEVASKNYSITVNSQSSEDVMISSIAPESGVVGTHVTLHGSGFTDNNMVLFNGSVAASNVSKNADGTLSFEVPNSLAPICLYSTPRCMMNMALMKITPGIYSVTVKNEHGTSNSVNFALIGDGSTSPTDTGSNTQGNTNISISITLKGGTVNGEVKILQQLLNSLGFTVSISGAGSPGNESNYFGQRTAEAVKRFQCKVLGLCQGSPETNGYGRVGPRTRAALNAEVK